MKKRYNHLKDLALVILGAVSLSFLNIIPGVMAFALIASWQLFEFATSKQCGACFTTAFTPEQLKEFDSLLSGFKSYDGMFKDLADLAKSMGGLGNIKGLSDQLATEKKRNAELDAQLKKLMKRAANFTSATGVKWIGGKPFVSDDCARALTSVFVLETARLGEKAMNLLTPNIRSHEALI